MAIRIATAFAVHPGDWLRTEIVEPHGLSVTDAAKHFGVTRQAMSALLNGRAGLSPDMAIGFEKAFGVKADTMLRCRRPTSLPGLGRMRRRFESSRSGAPHEPDRRAIRASGFV
ncbi:MAG TPA: HigA family addiction module antitoxin [Allosphingosinicella sp.]|jgi:addiction module HigA family antidote